MAGAVFRITRLATMLLRQPCFHHRNIQKYRRFPLHSGKIRRFQASGVQESQMFNVRSVSSAILMLTACSAACIGQTLPATFHTQTYTERASNSPYAVDVNNDG